MPTDIPEEVGDKVGMPTSVQDGFATVRGILSLDKIGKIPDIGGTEGEGA